MRLARRASLPIAIYMLTSAATASAECAWVLWERPVGSDHWSLGHTMHPAFAKKGECERAAQGQNYYELNLATAAEKRGEKLSRSVFYCFPDTVDPRGLKGREQ